MNPLAGCLPTLVQIPVFIGLYRSVLQLAQKDLLEESFLWIPSLQVALYSRPPPLVSVPVGARRYNMSLWSSAHGVRAEGGAREQGRRKQEREKKAREGAWAEGQDMRHMHSSAGGCGESARRG